jgi:tubulin epsilon
LHQDDDVVTSPYNSVLAMHQLQEHADAVFPVENQALHDIVQRIETQTHGGPSLLSCSSVS